MMESDWASLVLPIIFAMILGAAFLGYVRLGMAEAEAEWRNKTRKRFCVRCGCSLRGNTSGICPNCGKRFKPEM